MTTTVTSKCPHCGAQIVFEPKSKATICRYCSSMIAIKEVKGSDGPSLSGLLGNFQLKEIIPKHEYYAYLHNYGLGCLWITEQELMFKPGKIENLGVNLNDCYISFPEICGYKRVPSPYIGQRLMGLSDYAICVHKEDNIEERVFQILCPPKEADAIFNNIEYFRKQYFIKNGQPIQDLTIGDIHVSGDSIINAPFERALTVFMKTGIKITAILIVAVILMFIFLLIFA